MHRRSNAGGTLTTGCSPSMRRVVVLSALLAVAWLARDARWLAQLSPLSYSSPHAEYLAALERSGIAETPLAMEWIAASTRALAQATRVTLPYERELPFAGERPAAYAFRIALNRGQRVDVMTQVSTAVPTATFVDLFEPGTDEPSHETGALLAGQYEASADRDVIVRVQPELLRDGQLHISLRAAPAFRFPVAEARWRDLQSAFGDPRDGGRREHEGVDIFARRGTPVLSATDGIVTRVGEGGLGGRLVWVWNPGRGLRLYYAHLDEQLVTTGERVKAGDVLGTVGNTGNARTTSPHLHFGIYERGRGAIDPYWFIAPPGIAATSSR
ncbi:MAG TPA: M23 family metallopeptidase [Vicinamibacterales bacterium]|nr:M23 family metallopeptidase [Vicinamibacterales bacterium]